MAPKDESKSKDTTVTVNIEEFTKTRDSVLASLAQLQSAAFELSRAYINHSNTVLGRDTTSLDLALITSGITNTLRENGVLGARASSPGAKSDSGEKKKRKRAPPDPNAPKRALTPFFLFMQHNRSIIAEEMGPSAKPKDVSDEGTRRWAEMPEPQKEVWKKLYADNLAVYKEKVKAYKAGLPYTDDDSAKAANQLQQGVVAAEASEESEEEEAGEAEEEEEEEVEEEVEEEEEEEEESSPEPIKEPTPPRGGKRRRSEIRAKEAISPVTEKKARNESPEKKKRGARKEKEEPAASRKSLGGDAKRTKKRRKSEVSADE
ncbi:hypothetical protein ARAM_000873 [Aspergillus rambellii]|uniref:HMG box domain-containing protein n=1 Tax=Aspergillus rambellii TaxID=308745 RepID=A0A0F8XLB0_9EURO|nr:hypothetical protein ARAM_000873 [Aspergillus rambellii]